MYLCGVCQQTFATKSSRNRHCRHFAKCASGISATEPIKVKKELSLDEDQPSVVAERPKTPDTGPQFGKWHTYTVIYNRNPLDLDTSAFLNSCKEGIHSALNEALQHHKQIKFSLSFLVNCAQQYNPEDVKPFDPFFVQQMKTFKSKVAVLSCNREIVDVVNVVTTLLAMESNKETSQFAIINEILRLEVNIRHMQEKKGKFLPLPADIRASRSVVNMKNSDNFCFKWAIISAVSKGKSSNLHRITIYEIHDISQDIIECFGVKLDFSGMDFPANVWDAKIFEQRNADISVNIFGLEMLDEETSKIVGPLYRTRQEKSTHINLLYFEDGKKALCHYAYIRAMSRLLRKQFTKVHTKVDICNMCLKHFYDRKGFERHTQCKKLRVL